MQNNSLYKRIFEENKNEKPNNKRRILLGLVLLSPLISYLLLRSLSLGLEPYLIKVNALYHLYFYYTVSFCFLLCVIAFYSHNFQSFKKGFFMFVVGGLLFGFPYSLVTTFPVSSFFASVLIKNFQHKDFEEVYLIEYQHIPKYRKYEAISLLDQQPYTFQMPARFGPQDDLTEGTTVKLKGIEGKLGRLITSYEVVKPAPAKN